MTSKLDWTVYIIETENGKLYTGITIDLERRFWEHCSGIGAKYFRSQSPHAIVYTEMHTNRSEASKREYEIKKLNRSNKLKLIHHS
jgi:putative endonuclease